MDLRLPEAAGRDADAIRALVSRSARELAQTLGALHYSAGVTGSEVMSASGYTLKWLKL